MPVVGRSALPDLDARTPCKTTAAMLLGPGWCGVALHGVRCAGLQWQERILTWLAKEAGRRPEVHAAEVVKHRLRLLTKDR